MASLVPVAAKVAKGNFKLANGDLCRVPCRQLKEEPVQGAVQENKVQQVWKPSPHDPRCVLKLSAKLTDVLGLRHLTDFRIWTIPNPHPFRPENLEM